MLSIPKYIQDSEVVGAPITYKWRPSHQVTLMDDVPKNLERAIHGLSCKATFAIVLGTGEWLLWRLQGLSDYRQVYQYIEALWVSTVDEAYLKEDEMPISKEKKGDPAYGALYGLESALFNVTTNALLNHPERAKTAAGFVSFVRYTLPDTKAFDAWLQATIKRLAGKFPYDRDNPQGVIVPRGFLDPDADLDSGLIPKLLDEQLSSIDHAGNPFLASPQELKAAGFKGEPYRFQP